MTLEVRLARNRIRSQNARCGHDQVGVHIQLTIENRVEWREGGVLKSSFILLRMMMEIFIR